MKNQYRHTFLAVTAHKDGKYSSFVLPVTCSDNLAKILNEFDSANICPTKKEAERIVDHWNNCHRKNGVYQFA